MDSKNRKLFIFFVFLTCAVFSGCSGEDTGPTFGPEEEEEASGTVPVPYILGEEALGVDPLFSDLLKNPIADQIKRIYFRKGLVGIDDPKSNDLATKFAHRPFRSTLSRTLLILFEFRGGSKSMVIARMEPADLDQILSQSDFPNCDDRVSLDILPLFDENRKIVLKTMPEPKEVVFCQYDGAFSSELLSRRLKEVKVLDNGHTFACIAEN